MTGDCGLYHGTEGCGDRLMTWEEKCSTLAEECAKLEQENRKLKEEIAAMRTALDRERYLGEKEYLRGRVDGLEYAARCNGVSGGELSR